MSSRPVLAESAGEVRRAVEKTLRLGGVRLASETLSNRPPGGPGLIVRGEGVADLAGRRTDFRETVGPAVSEPIANLARGLARKHPWLLRDDELGELDEDVRNVTGRNVYVGGAVFMTHPYTHEWFYTDGDVSSPHRRCNDPLWILEVLACTDEAARLDADEVRGETCDRFGFHVDLRLHADRVATPSEPLVGPPHVVGEVCTDQQEQIRQVRWSEIPRRRMKRGRRAASEAEPQSLLSTTLALWDFGIDVSIDVPQVRPSPASNLEVLTRLAGGLWRRKRDYERARRSTVD